VWGAYLENIQKIQQNDTHFADVFVIFPFDPAVSFYFSVEVVTPGRKAFNESHASD
jgi:hypothetical protein